MPPKKDENPNFVPKGSVADSPRSLLTRTHRFVPTNSHCSLLDKVRCSLTDWINVQGEDYWRSPASLTVWGERTAIGGYWETGKHDGTLEGAKPMSCVTESKWIPCMNLPTHGSTLFMCSNQQTTYADDCREELCLLHELAPGIIRQTMHDTTLSSGYNRIFWTESENFRPERGVVSSLTMLHQWNDPRTCGFSTCFIY